MAKYFTSGWCYEASTQSSKSTNEIMAGYLRQARRILQPDDDLYFLGDLTDNITELRFYDQLPDCGLHILVGKLEAQFPQFEEEVYRRLPQHRNRTAVMSGVQFVELGPRRQTWRMAYAAEALRGFSLAMPSLCGEAYDSELHSCGDREPIISVRASIWGGIVSEAQILGEYIMLCPPIAH